jgi:hypothetical protein
VTPEDGTPIPVTPDDGPASPEQPDPSTGAPPDGPSGAPQPVAPPGNTEPSVEPDPSSWPAGPPFEPVPEAAAEVRLSVPLPVGELFPPPLGDKKPSRAKTDRAKSRASEVDREAPPTGGASASSQLAISGESAVVRRSLPVVRSPQVLAAPRAHAAPGLPVADVGPVITPANARHSLAASGLVVVLGVFYNGFWAWRRRAAERYLPA